MRQPSNRNDKLCVEGQFRLSPPCCCPTLTLSPAVPQAAHFGDLSEQLAVLSWRRRAEEMGCYGGSRTHIEKHTPPHAPSLANPHKNTPHKKTATHPQRRPLTPQHDMTPNTSHSNVHQSPAANQKHINTKSIKCLSFISQDDFIQSHVSRKQIQRAARSHRPLPFLSV